MDRSIHGTIVYGIDVNEFSQCAHWNSSLDIISIRFACCDKYYPCYQCHLAAADHPPQKWLAHQSEERAILCGACGYELTIRQYLEGSSSCPYCHSAFNPGCKLHRHLYFDF